MLAAERSDSHAPATACLGATAIDEEAPLLDPVQLVNVPVPEQGEGRLRGRAQAHGGTAVAEDSAQGLGEEFR